MSKGSGRRPLLVSNEEWNNRWDNIFGVDQVARGYTKEFLIDAFVSRYNTMDEDVCLRLIELAEKLWDTLEGDKDKFREYCSLDAAAIKKFKLEEAS